MTPKVSHLRREQVAHLVRAAAGITNETTFVLIGTGAAIAQLKATPFDLMATREIDIYAPDAADPAAVSDLIDGSIGEGSPFDETFGYYAHGIGQDTAVLPDDWRLRARPVTLPMAPGVTCICPDVSDIALSKLCAWREKDRMWLDAAWRSGLLDAGALRSQSRSIGDPRAPSIGEIDRRIDAIEAGLLASERRPAHRIAEGPSSPDTAEAGGD